METVPDYRLEQCEHLRGKTFIRKVWHRPSYNPDWDHDHCAGCWARIWDHPQDEVGSFGEGYAVVGVPGRPDDYDWLCPPCFGDLRHTLQFKELETKQ
jgi:hypothetical protein